MPRYYTPVACCVEPPDKKNRPALKAEQAFIPSCPSIIAPSLAGPRRTRNSILLITKVLSFQQAGGKPDTDKLFNFS